VTPQDQIVIGGSFTSISGYSRNGIARLNSDGSVDTTFNPGLGVNGSLLCLGLQTNGEIVIGGNFSEVNNVPCYGVARFDTKGALDTSFAAGAGTGTSGSIHSIASQPDGRTLIGGFFNNFDGTNINYIARLNGDGSLGATPQLLSANLYFGAYLYGTPTNTYRIEWTSDLETQSLWTPLFDVTLQSNSLFFADPNPPTGQRFYRAVQLPQ